MRLIIQYGKFGETDIPDIGNPVGTIMKKIRKVSLGLTVIVLLAVLLTGCGRYNSGPRDGKGPRRDGSGGGPCSLLSTDTETTFYQSVNLV